MTPNNIYQGNCLDVLKDFPDNSIDSIVTDPPYELGFMGKSWDSTGIANNKEMWSECLRVLKPGGHLLAFSGTRTYHRMASAIEDAGFEVRDMIEWVYGSGFPKSRNIGKDVEKTNVGGLKNLKQIGTKKGIKCETGTKGYSYSKEYVAGVCMGGKQISGDIPVYEINNEWNGWGTALKPAHEPICMARKPLSESTVAENVLKYGTGGINIDESRVENTGKSTLRPLGKSAYQKGGGIVNGGVAGTHEVESEFGGGHDGGRFPANLIHDGSDEVKECFPENVKGEIGRVGRKSSGNYEASNYKVGIVTEIGMRDSGSASRFFKSIIYQAKASKSERNKGCEGLDEKVTKVTNMYEMVRDDGTVRKLAKKQNNHPTVKPIALMEYLIKMVTPKGGIVLDPFTGSGSTLVAAKQNGFQYVGIEMTPEYIEIAQARLK